MFGLIYLLWRPDMKSWLVWKNPDGGKDWGQEKKGMTEDKMVGWHLRLNRQWVWVGSRSWWWTGRPGVLQSMGSQRVRHDWVTELKTTFRFAYVTKAERLILKIWESFRKRIYFRRVKSKTLQNIGFTFSSLHVEENLKAMSWKWTRHLIFDKWRVACNLILVALY